MKKKIVPWLLLAVVLVGSVISVGIYVAHAASGNLIQNPSMETADASGTAPQGWQKGNWGTNTTNFIYKNNGQDGSKSVYVSMSAYTNGDAKWYFDAVAVSPNTEYVFSDYYKATVATSLVAWIKDSAGNDQYQSIGDVPARSAWTKAQFTFTTPANAATLTVFHLISANGNLQTDNYNLHTASSVVITDNVPNNSLEQVSDTDSTKPLAWETSSWGTNTPNFTYLNTGHTGTHSVKVAITSYTDGDAKWYYTPQTAIANKLYRFTDFYQSTILSRAIVEATLSDGSTRYIDMHFADPASSWTQYTDTFLTPPGTVTITVLHVIAGVGSLTTDDYSVTDYTPTAFNRGLVSLTFDDGWATQYTNGLPLLNSHHLNGTFYLISSFLDTDGYLTSDQALAIQQAGNQIGSHTVDHPDLTSLDSTALNTELSQSKTDLQAQFGTIQDFATPYGNYNSQVINAIKTYYRSHRSTDMGFNSKDRTDLYNLRCQNVLVTTTVDEINGWIDKALQDKTWLILTFHDIDNPGGEDSISTANFDAVLTHLNSVSAPVLTVNQAINEVSPQL